MGQQNKVFLSYIDQERMKDGSLFFDLNKMSSGLNWLRKVRNDCAHSERIYGVSKENARVITVMHRRLGKRYEKDRHLQLIDAFIHMRYFLSATEYRSFLTFITEQLNQLEKEIDPEAFRRVRSRMGIRDVADLNILLKNLRELPYEELWKGVK